MYPCSSGMDQLLHFLNIQLEEVSGGVVCLCMCVCESVKIENKYYPQRFLSFVCFIRIAAILESTGVGLPINFNMNDNMTK